MLLLSIDDHLNKYMSDTSIIERIKSYVSLHETIGEEIFPYLGIKDYSFYLPKKSINPETFLRRIPFYFYRPEMTIGDIGELDHYISGSLRRKGVFEENIEYLFITLERIHYHHEIEVSKIFNYPVDQTGYVRQTEFLFKWAHYLDLIESLPQYKKMPKQFIVAYNEALEHKGLQPIIFPLTLLDAGYINRDGRKLSVSGTFPCDHHGAPILRWIGIKIKNPQRVWAEVDDYCKGKLHIIAGPKTAVWGLNKEEDEDDFWDRLYTGPQLMEFDSDELKYLRKRQGYTQKEVAEAIGASVRSYQKWENGEAAPDSHNLIRLVNFLDIQDIQELTRYLDIDDID